MEHRPPPRPNPYPAEKARVAQIILRSRRQRAIFIGGLVGFVVLVILLRIFAV